MMHGQHIATTWQILRRVAHRWGCHYGVSAVLLVFEHEIDGTATPFRFPRWGGDPSLLELTHDAEYAQTMPTAFRSYFFICRFGITCTMRSDMISCSLHIRLVDNIPYNKHYTHKKLCNYKGFPACQRSQNASLQSGFLYDKKAEKSRRNHLWMASFFKFIAANLSLTQAVTAGSPRYGV